MDSTPCIEEQSTKIGKKNYSMIHEYTRSCTLTYCEIAKVVSEGSASQRILSEKIYLDVLRRWIIRGVGPNAAFVGIFWPTPVGLVAGSVEKGRKTQKKKESLRVFRTSLSSPA